jgi:hypothetical protein
VYLSNESLLVILLVGLVAGWLAGKIVRGAGFGLIGDLCSSAAGCCRNLASIWVPELSPPSSTPPLAPCCFCSWFGCCAAAAPSAAVGAGAAGGNDLPQVVPRGLIVC